MHRHVERNAEWAAVLVKAKETPPNGRVALELEKLLKSFPRELRGKA